MRWSCGPALVLWSLQCSAGPSWWVDGCAVVTSVLSGPIMVGGLIMVGGRVCCGHFNAHWAHMLGGRVCCGRAVVTLAALDRWRPACTKSASA
jgi:hypothetical protein